jgi:prepilin-type N-terminal cleavage/methylation domain-containing protein
MKMAARQPRSLRGYTLAEMIAVMVIAAMVLTAILGVYGRANRAAEAVLTKIETPVLAAEVLQLMARDLDRIMGADGVSIQVKNGYDNGFITAQLILRRTVEDAQKQKQLLEEIVWRAGYDYDSAVPGLVIYRSYGGIGLEDELLDRKREELESQSPLIPICRGVTFFRIEIPKGEGVLDQWSDTALPTGVKVTLSFADPYETVRGTQDVLEYEKTSRTIAIDRTRTISFKLPPGTGGDEAEQGPESEGADETPARRTRR